MKYTQFTVFDITSNISRIETILSTDILARHNKHHPLLWSAIIEVIICLHDLLQKLRKIKTDNGFTVFDAKVTFDDDLALTSKKLDVTDTVALFRDALCHIGSNTHFFEKNMAISYSILYGNTKAVGWDGSGNRPNIESDYPDDTCFYIGKYRLYLIRHILRAKLEAEINFACLVVFSTSPQLVALQMPELAGVILQLASQADNMYP
jgi:hypothetical protein